MLQNKPIVFKIGRNGRWTRSEGSYFRKFYLFGKELAKFFVDVVYKYDVDAQVLNDIIENNDDNEVIGNK